MSDQTDTTTIADLKDLVASFVCERDWERFHTAKNVSMAIAIESAELMDLFKWCNEAQSSDLMAESPTREAAIEEIADIVIYCLVFANQYGVDLATAIKQKIVKNSRKYSPDMCQVAGSFR